MNSFGFTGPDSEPVFFEQDTPIASGKDLLIKIDAIAINPVDIKIKAGLTPPLKSPRIVGWDACGTVIATGDDVELFQVGDNVFYAGDVTRPGCYASHQLVDERIVAKAPKSLTPAEASVMPLCSITAWEALFSRLKINAELEAGKNILIIGGAGGVGSIAIQLAKVVAKMNVITTASRAESEQWCRKLGADHVINHHSDMVLQYRTLGLKDPDYILCLNDTDQHFDAMAELIAPQGMICTIVGSKEKHDLDCLKSKSAGLVWEFMFTRPMFNTDDLIAQHQVLQRIADLLDEGKLVTTLTETVGPMTADNITKAHHQIGLGTTIGKLALTAIM